MVRHMSGPAGLDTQPVNSVTERVRKQINELPHWPRPKLVERWGSIYGRPPPKSIKRAFLERAIAWHVQAKAYGGLKPATRRYLLDVARKATEAHKHPTDYGSSGASKAVPARRLPLRAGMRLVREWNGKAHTVDVLDKGFAYNGKIYGSLSPIAKAITGTNWSGPRFFSP